MYIILILTLVSVAAGGLLFFLGKVGLLAALLIAFGVYILLHLLFLVFIWFDVQRIPTDRPIERQDPVCRVCCGPFISVVNCYAHVRPVVTGLEKLPKTGRFLFVSNHRSAFDPLVVMDRLRDYNISFISKPSNLQLPIVGRGAYGIGFLPIDRENNRNALKTILTAADYLKKDICSMAIYPEGTRSRTGELLPFHAGSLKIAQKAQVPIVVAAVHGSENVKRYRLFSRTDVCLDILNVISADEVCESKTDALSERIRGMIASHLETADLKSEEEA